jgi:hypothetical protein
LTVPGLQQPRHDPANGGGVGLVPLVREPSDAAGRRRPRADAWLPWLIIGCYLVASVALTWRLWADPAGREQTGDVPDVDVFAWFMRYSATAVAHGHLPALVTTTLNAPGGISLMWNTSILLPAILLTPVTLLAGPQVSLTITLTLGFAGSAVSMFFVLRRWHATLAAAALGGAVYGFSEALVNSGIGHYDLQLAVLPPLIIDAVLRILTGRAHPVSGGAWLGVLAVAQIFISEELLVDTALTALVVTVVLAGSHPRAALDRARDAALGFGVAAVMTLLLSGRALWVQFHGQLAEHSRLLFPFAGTPTPLVEPPPTLLLHSWGTEGRSYYYGLSEYLGYLGWPILIVLLACAVWFWRDLRVRTAAVTCAVVELCALGGANLVANGVQYPGWLLPWHWLQGLPGLAQIMPDRFSILADGAAAAVLAFSLDLVRSTVRGARRWLRPAFASVAVLALVPLIPLPFSTTTMPPVPAGWQAAFASLRLAPDARVLVVPLPVQTQTQAMRWQAETGEPGSLIGGYFLGPGQGGQATFSPGVTAPAAGDLDALGQVAPPAARQLIVQLRTYLTYWRPAAVVAVTSRGSRTGRSLAMLLGRPAVAVGQVLAWRYPLQRPRVSSSSARGKAARPARTQRARGVSRSRALMRAAPAAMGCWLLSGSPWSHAGCATASRDCARCKAR